MSRAASDGGLLEKVLSCTQRAVLLYGPAGCGKTAAAIGMYRHYSPPDGQARCLLLAPNAAFAGQLRNKLIDCSPSGVLVGPQVATFAALAARILAQAADAGRVLTGLQRHLLLRDIVEALSAEKALSAIGAVADTPGLIVALDRAIAELKRAAIEPEALRKVAGRAGKNRDLLEVYSRYQKHLRDGGLYDVEGQMWQARDALLSWPAETSPLEGIDALAVDGFTDFTPTQLQMLVLLSSRLERVLVTLPFAQDGRERLWHWTRRTLDNIRRAFGPALAEIDAAQRGSRQEAQAWPLGQLAGKVFDIDASPCEVPAGLSAVACAGLEAEVAAAARTVKGLLLKGAGPGTVAVLARSLEGCRRPVRRIFAEHDIPISQQAEALTEAPVVRFALDAASVAPDFAFRQVLSVIKNSYFRPASLGPFDERTVAAAEMLIREGNVFEGRSAYSQAAERLARRLADSRGGDDEGISLGPLRVGHGLIQDAAAMLQRLFDLSESFGRAGGAGGLSAIVEEMDLAGAACSHDEPAIVARDLRALAALRGALKELGDRRLSLDQLRQALAAVACPPAGGESVVDVLDVLDSRCLRYEHVVLLGVSEDQFPSPQVESSLLGEADRAEWAARGLVLDNRGDLAAREMFLFYLAATRARRTLTVSFMESDSAGRAGAPSNFLLSLLEPCGGLDGLKAQKRLIRTSPGQFLPHERELATPRETLIAAFAGLFGREGVKGPAALAWSLRHAPRKVARASMGLYARHMRWLAGECNEFDGRVSDAALKEKLAARFPAQAVLSATQLNSYGLCPWQFFAAHVLKLQPLSEPERRLEPVTKGIFCHNVLFRMFSGLKARRSAVSLAELDDAKLQAALDEAIEAESAAVEAARPPYPLLWRIQKRQLRRELADYLLASRSRPGVCGEALALELSFGLGMRPGQPADPRSTTEPVCLSTPAGQVRIVGRIDRVDRVRIDEREGLLVVDYKTGRLPGQSEVQEGRNLQLHVYVEAAEALLGDQALAGAFHAVAEGGKLSQRLLGASCDRAGRYALDEDFQAQRQAAIEKIGRHVAGMSAGRFDVLPTQRCPDYCPYRRICHFAPARAELKVPPAQEAQK